MGSGRPYGLLRESNSTRLEVTPRLRCLAPAWGCNVLFLARLADIGYDGNVSRKIKNLAPGKGILHFLLLYSVIKTKRSC